ncbi:MAG: DNA polymerase III subunit delta [Proteobacteria bacterium]|nr:MAG: DNA polymerase III subunit delta [Pseudomonadota bacterium]
MYKRELENLIRQKSLPKSFFLYGVCNYQVSYFGDVILDIWEAEDTLTFYFEDYDFSLAKRHLSQNSLFGNKNILAIKTQKNIPKKELDTLVDICQKNQNSHFLLQCFADEKNTKNMTSSFAKKKNADFARFFKANMGEAMQLLSLEAKKLNLNISQFALNHLYLTHNEELSLAVNELSKLSILEKEIQKEDINELIFGLGEVNLGDFIVNLIDKKDIKAQFETLMQAGNHSEIFIINSIQAYVCELFAFHSYIKLHGNFDPKQILGYPLPMPLAQKRAAQGMNLDLATFKNLLHTLANAEYTIKKGSFKDKQNYLLSTLLKLQGLLRA